MKKRKPVRRKPSTALARRRPEAPVARRTVSLVLNDPNQLLPQHYREESGAMSHLAASVLPSEPSMSAAFVGTLKLSKEQIDALRRPVADSEIEWKAAKIDGPEIIPYLSHNGYRDRLDAAFGLGGWGMVPVGMPKNIGDEFIYVPYAMVIDGLPRVYAWGEQQKNKMTYGDALEGAKSNAIVRCGKELGIARELWNRTNVRALNARKGRGGQMESGPANAPAQRPSSDGRENEKITDPQRKRLWAIAGHAGRAKPEISVWLKAAYQLDSTKDITRGQYDTICAALEKRGPLPLPKDEFDQTREPGQEG